MGLLSVALVYLNLTWTQVDLLVYETVTACIVLNSQYIFTYREELKLLCVVLDIEHKHVKDYKRELIISEFLIFTVWDK